MDAVSIGPQYSLGINRSHGGALLRTSLAQVVFVDRVILRDSSLDYLSFDDYQSVDDALMSLAKFDPNTCCTALETLNGIIEMKCSNGLAVPMFLIMAHVHRVVLEADEVEVISKAQSVLADALQGTDHKDEFFSTITEDQTMRTLAKLESQCLNGPPSNMQSALHLLGFFLDSAYTQYLNRRPLILRTTARYIRLLRMTIIDTNPFDTRHAAIQSLSALTHIHTASSSLPSTSPLILALALTLYDLLNDDDDEIRDAAALTTGRFLRAQGQVFTTSTTVPILTTHRLASFLATRYSSSKHLIKTALHRLTNTPPTTPLFTTPFADTFARESLQDSSLFATEKQNLYYDDALDAHLWARVLVQTSPPRSVSAHLAQWVLSGLAVLTAQAKRERDGALGWASKAEVFALCVRVVGAAEVVVGWGTGERGDVLRALAEFAETLRVSEGHGLVREMVERVLEKEVLGMLGRVKGSLMGVEGW